MRYTSVIKKSLCLIALLSNSSIAKQYDIDDTQNIQYNGYAGYQSIISSANIASTYGGLNTPQLGLNVVYNNGNFQIFNQFRYDGRDAIGNILVYNFAQYSMNMVQDLNFTIKAGKLRNEFGLYNTSRVNPTTRQGVIPPQSMYWNVFNEFLTSGVGVSAALQYKDLELSYTIEDPTVVNPAQVNRVFYAGLLNQMHTSFGSYQNVNLTYTPSINSTTKLSWHRFTFGSDTSPLTAKLFPPLVNSVLSGETATAGTEYRFNKLLLSVEGMLFKSQLDTWSDIESLNKSFSTTAVYELTDTINIRANYNETWSNNVFLHPQPWLSYYKDFNVGINYHQDNWTFNIEGHHINGARTIDTLEIGKNYDSYKEWYMIGTNITYSF